MDLNVNMGPKRGESFTSGSLAHLLGLQRAFKDMTGPLSTDTLRSERPVWCQLVKNRKGAAILPGQLLVWKAGYGGIGVDLAAATAAQLIVGVADWMLPTAGVADGEYFWMVTKGPTKFINDANATLSEFAALMVSPSVAGSVRAATGDTMVAINSQVGIAEASILASATGYGFFKAPFNG